MSFSLCDEEGSPVSGLINHRQFVKVILNIGKLHGIGEQACQVFDSGVDRYVAL